MKHVFIINPTAGKRNCTAELMEMAKGLAARHKLDLECILTKRPGHAMETARAFGAMPAAETAPSTKQLTASPDMKTPP